MRLLIAAAVLLPLAASAQLVQSDGTAGLFAGVVTAPMLTSKLGATINSGHTRNAVAMSFPAVALGGTSITVSGISDPVSGYAPSAGAWCGLASSTATPLPVNMVLTCTFTATPGTATVTATPLGGLALGAQSFTANVFWNW